MISTHDIDAVSRGNVIDDDGDKVGSVGQVYLDNRTGEPEWVTVKTGLFGTKSTFVPLSGATVRGEDLHVPHDKATIKDAPKIDDESELSPAEEDELYRYYGIQGGDDRSTDDRSTDDRTADRRTADDQVARERDQRDDSATTDRSRTDGDTPVVPVVAATGGEHRAEDRRDDTTDRDRLTGGNGLTGTDTRRDETTDRDRLTDSDRLTAGRRDETSGRSITRSEEQVNVGTERVESGTARLRKYVVTEQQTHTVPVSHEEVTLEREPITDDNRGDLVSGGELSEEEHEVTLHAERAVVDTEVVPVERIAMGTERVTGEETVTADVRKEQVDLSDEGRDTTDRRSGQV